MPRLLLVALLAVLALAASGCSGPEDEPGPSTSASPATSTAPPSGPGVVSVSGHVVPLGTKLIANVSAFNEGPETYGIAKAYCVSAYGAWTARLSGPPGDDLDYRDPRGMQLGCPGQSGIPMPPRSFVNWTFAGDWATGRCDMRYVCDNLWDGNLTAGDGTRAPAPPGDYLWTFTFTYSVGASGDPARIERQDLVLPLTL